MCLSKCYGFCTWRKTLCLKYNGQCRPYCWRKEGFEEAPPSARLNWFLPESTTRVSPLSPSTACALACFVFVFLKKSQNWGMQTHIVLLCLLFAGLAVEAKSSMGLLQRSKRFSQFKTVRLGEVWNDLKSDKVVSYTLTRDLTVVGELLHCHPAPPVLVCPDALDLPPPHLLERLHRGEQAHRPPWL